MSQYDPSLVTCIDPDTGNRLWTCNHLVEPTGVTTDRSGRIIVATGGDTTTVTLETLDADTGIIIITSIS
jgi:outer membrane protein assembly factor BamB